MEVDKKNLPLRVRKIIVAFALHGGLLYLQCGPRARGRGTGMGTRHGMGVRPNSLLRNLRSDYEDGPSRVFISSCLQLDWISY